MIEITFPILVAVTMGVTEVIKIIIGNTRFTPLIALFLGVGVALGAFDVNFQAVLTGLAIGLSACGLFSGTKAVIKG